MIFGPLDINEKSHWGAFVRTKQFVDFFNLIRYKVYLVAVKGTDGFKLVKETKKHVLGSVDVFRNDKLNDFNSFPVHVFRNDKFVTTDLKMSDVISSVDIILIRYFRLYDILRNRSLIFAEPIMSQKAKVILDLDDHPMDLIGNSFKRLKKLLISFLLVRRINSRDILLFSAINQTCTLKNDYLFFPNLIYHESDRVHNFENAFLNSGNILFVANLKHTPNFNGLIWFLKFVAPLVKEKSKYTLNIVGEYNLKIEELLLKELKNSKMTIYFHGNINRRELDGCYETNDIVIIPIFEGAGSCVKTLEAYFKKKKIVTSEMGIRGIQIDRSSNQFYISDNPIEWAEVLNSENDFKPESVSITPVYNFESIKNSFKNVI